MIRERKRLPQMNANQRKSVAIDSGSSTLLGSICVYTILI
ncbi:MAG: hypothetical protein [Olavius algarvensis Gamma 1 endosymbiont]|nr:MAG: hypothetical protein [Olavius algarvensis Gamma 1 endosymbiont]